MEKEKFGNIDVIMPGYIIEAILAVPTYHPHTIWWLAYVIDFIRGKKIDDVINNPPWPIPKNKHYSEIICLELLEHNWLSFQPDGNKIIVSKWLKSLYDQKGENGLILEMLKYDEIAQQWWIDSLEGNVLSTLRSIQYDFDPTKKLSPRVEKLRPELTRESLLEMVNLDIFELLQLSDNKKDFLPNQLFNSFITGEIKVVGQRDIKFQLMQESKFSDSRILPNDLANLEETLLIHRPELFGKRKRILRKRLRWIPSPIEKFALTLEKFPNQIENITSFSHYSYLASILSKSLDDKIHWEDWVKFGHKIEPVVGESDFLFSVLKEFCGGFKDRHFITNYAGQPEYIIILSSFLNVNNLIDEDGLIFALEEIPDSTKILLIYGHANDDPPTKQNQDIDEYKNKLFSIIPNLKNNLVLIPTSRRSHEKILINSNGDWLLGSWNVTSSNPGSKLFESCVIGNNYNICETLLGKLQENIDHHSGFTILRSCNDFIQSKKSESKTPASFESNFSKLIDPTNEFIKIIENLNEIKVDSDIKDYYTYLLTQIRFYLSYFLRYSKITFINQLESRDLILSQIKSSKTDIFFASDRISSSAIDQTLVKDLNSAGSEGKRFVRMLWGREWEQETNLGKELREQLKEAKMTIKGAIEVLQEQLATNIEPMENHAKFAVFDSARGLITSENVLSYAGEKDEYESRELGMFIESIPINRYIIGKAIYHRLHIFQPPYGTSEIVYRPYEWIVRTMDHYFSLKEFRTEGVNPEDINVIRESILQEIEIPEEIDDDFDRNLQKLRIQKLSERLKLIPEDFLNYLAEQGKASYLLQITGSNAFIPLFEPINNEIVFKLETLNLEKYITKKDNKFIEKEGIKTTTDNEIINESNNVLINEILDNMVIIKKGSFIMGTNDVDGEGPAHKVTITKDFLVSKYLVTQKIWESVMGSSPAIPNNMKNPNYPVINISYNEMNQFINKLNKLCGSKKFDLLTEAQWEYVCRAGSTGEYCFGNDHKKLGDYAWTQLNAEMQLHTVGLKKPNNWGVYDMHCLTYEAVKDDQRKFRAKDEIDPLGPINSEDCGYRGGSWGRYPDDKRKWSNHFRCSFRGKNRKDSKNLRDSFRIMAFIN